MAKGQRRVASAKDPILSAVPQACVDEDKAVELMERLRWQGKPECPHCESQSVYKMKDRKTGQRNKRYLWRCLDCKRQFSVRIGSIFEDSRIPMRVWVHIFWRACSSKKGIPALQISRETGLSYKSALFAMHRVRCAMGDDHSTPEKLSGIVEADETFIGGRPRYRGKRGVNPSGHGSPKPIVMGMVQRGGNVRLRHIDRVTARNLQGAVMECVDAEALLMTDQEPSYRSLWRLRSGGHEAVNHSKREYVRGQAHTNTCESVWSLLKRGMMGSFHSVSKKHLPKYLNEFEHRWNTRYLTDGERTAEAIRKAVGKHMTYAEHVL